MLKLPKNVQSSKSPKITTNSTFRVKPGILKECVSECSVSARVSIQGPDRPRSLVQPSPGFSSWIQPGQGPGALPSCPKAQGECLASRELPREVTRPRSPSQCPGMSSGQAQEKLLFQPIGNVPRTEKHMFSEARTLQKTLSWAFYLIYLTFKKLKFYFSCFHLCLKEVRHIGILLPVSHICLQIAFPVSHIGFTISYNFSNLMVHWKRRLLCSWITATLIWYIGSYMLLPIDFNGKLEIFLKHFKKKKIFFFGLHVWVIGLWLFFRYFYFRFKPCELCFFF